MKKLKIAVIGAGRWGGFHAQKLAKNARGGTQRLVDPRPKTAGEWPGRMPLPGILRSRQSPRTHRRRSDRRPTALHYQLAKEFLDSNTHLLVEKPLCLNSARPMNSSHWPKTQISPASRARRAFLIPPSPPRRHTSPIHKLY